MNARSMFVRQTSILCFILAVALAVVLLTMKYEVQSLKDELGSLDREIVRERETIQVLHAEFAYLTQPERLHRLAGAYLGLVAVQPRQLTTFASLDAALDQAAASAAKSPKQGTGTTRAKTYGSAETGGVRVASRTRIGQR